MRPKIEQFKAVGDFMVSNIWDITVTTNFNAGWAQTPENLNLMAVSSDLPKRTNNAIEVNIRGHKVRQPGDWDYTGTITLTLVETDDAIVHDWITNWREAIIETNTNRQLKKSDITVEVIMHKMNRQNEPTWTINLFEVFLEDYDFGSLNETGEAIQPTITLSYDYFVEGPAGTPLNLPA